VAMRRVPRTPLAALPRLPGRRRLPTGRRVSTGSRSIWLVLSVVRRCPASNRVAWTDHGRGTPGRHPEGHAFRPPKNHPAAIGNFTHVVAGRGVTEADEKNHHDHRRRRSRTRQAPLLTIVWARTTSPIAVVASGCSGGMSPLSATCNTSQDCRDTARMAYENGTRVSTGATFDCGSGPCSRGRKTAGCLYVR
jgi:hypothetical protein